MVILCMTSQIIKHFLIKIERKKLQKKLYGHFLWMRFNCLKASSGKQFTFYHQVPRNSWYSFYWPQKDGRLSWPWSHPVVLNTGPLEWESSALTTRPLLRLFHWLIVRLFQERHAIRCPYRHPYAERHLEG